MTATLSPTGELAPSSDYTQDFAGMATEPFSDEIRRVLAERPNHDDVEVKPEGICFMPGVWYRRQLTRAFGAGGWALKPNAPYRTMEGSVLWSGALYAHGRWIGEAVGGCESKYMEMANRIQSAKTDCLSKICGHALAMASELWEKTWREAWMAEYTTKTWREPKGEKKGAWVYSLKNERNPRAADLMGEPKYSPGGAPSPDVGPKTGAAPAVDPAQAPPPAKVLTGQITDNHAASTDTGEAADPAAYAAIASLLKANKFTKGTARAFFMGHFGVELHTALTAMQADAAHALLMAWGKPVYEKVLEQLRAAGTVRS